MTRLQRLDCYLDHIVEAIGRINNYTKNMDGTEFLSNHLVQDAVIRNLEIIGEASNNIIKRYPNFAAKHPELPLSSAYQMRNAISHGYFKIDFEVVWKTICNDLPRVGMQIKNAHLKSSPANNDGGMTP